MTKVTLKENNKIKERIMSKPHAHSHKYNYNEKNTCKDSKKICDYKVPTVYIDMTAVLNKTNSTNLYHPTKGYLRETCKSQNINPIYLTLSSPCIIQIITNTCQVCFSA